MLNFNLKKLKARKTFKKGTLVLDPHKYWDFVLLIVLMMVVFAFVYGFILFKKTDKEFLSSSIEINKEVGKIKKDKLDKALEYFKIRETRSAQIISDPSPIIDPSL